MTVDRHSLSLMTIRTSRAGPESEVVVPGENGGAEGVRTWFVLRMYADVVLLTLTLYFFIYSSFSCFRFASEKGF